ncbi:hypothetical protein JW851_00065 [Candidatus Woesearchaeota archaeon]|nr:hypothetical protein [Candidatus Woesearchaeota archaeon]
MTKKKILTQNEKEDIPKNIVVLVLMIAIIVSVTGTWMVMDSIHGLETGASVSNNIGPAKTIALNIEYDNTTQEAENGNIK